MNKSIWIVLAVVAVIAGTYYADRATRLSHKTPAVRLGAPSGTPAPDVTMKDLDGKDVATSDYKGKVILANFWATWCEPCREEIPELIELQQKYGPRGFVVLGIAMDDEGKSVVAPFVQKERFDVGGAKSQMDYPILIGNEAVGDKFGGMLGLPTSVLISRDGKQIKRITGPIDSKEIAKTIEAQL